MSDVLDAAISTPPMERLTDGRAWARAMLAAEAALARAEADVGLVPVAIAEEIAEVARTTTVTDEDLVAAVLGSFTPVAGLLDTLRARLSPEAGDHVHLGATTQDIVDTAMMLVVRDGLALIADALSDARRAAAALARAHRDTIVAGRTLLQHASPTTFGLRAAGWLLGLVDATEQLDRVRRTRLVAQLGGSVGTLAAAGSAAGRLPGAYAARLGLADPRVPWHTRRNGILDIAAVLGAAAAACDKPALDVLLLAETELGEVHETTPAGGSRSSALPQKRNQVGALCVRAAARRATDGVAALFTAGAHELERSAGAWQLEPRRISDVLCATHAAVSRVAAVLDGLAVDADRASANLDAGGGTIVAEAVVTGLSDRLGRRQAHRVVAEAAAGGGSGGEFRASLLAAPEVAAVVSPAELDALLDPRRFVGIAGELVDRALDVDASTP